MISKKHFLSIAIIATALLATATQALASGPDCSTGRNKRGYDAGKLIGSTIVRQAWNSSDQIPDDFDDFMDTVRDIVSNAIANLPNDASDYTKCRAKGLSQGVCNELEEIQDEIGNVCLLDGEIWGALSADLYCSLSIEFGAQDALGLIPVSPTNLCGENFEEGCHEEFSDVASASALCQPFTVAPNDDVFADWQVGVCAYELP